MSDETTQFVEEFEAMWRHPTPDGFAALFHPEGRLRHPSMPEAIPAAQAAGYMQTLQKTLPDISLEVHTWAANGADVLLEYTLSASVNGQTVQWGGADRFTLRDGRAIEGVAYFDTRPLQAALETAERTSGGVSR